MLKTLLGVLLASLVALLLVVLTWAMYLPQGAPTKPHNQTETYVLHTSGLPLAGEIADGDFLSSSPARLSLLITTGLDMLMTDHCQVPTLTQHFPRRKKHSWTIFVTSKCRFFLVCQIPAPSLK
jgi:hypothetical protein